MIMRTWRGAVGAADAEQYLAHQASTGVREYQQAPGNAGVLVLRRTRGDLCEVTTVSFWESVEAVRRFAGEDLERAKFYPGDDEFLVEKDLPVNHYEVVSADVDVSALHAQAR